MQSKNLLRAKDVCKKLGIGRTELWERTKNGDLPQPIRMGTKCVLYVEQEIDAYIDRLIAARDKGKAA